MSPRAHTDCPNDTCSPLKPYVCVPIESVDYLRRTSVLDGHCGGCLGERMGCCGWSQCCGFLSANMRGHDARYYIIRSSRTRPPKPNRDNVRLVGIQHSHAPSPSSCFSSFPIILKSSVRYGPDSPKKAETQTDRRHRTTRLDTASTEARQGQHCA